MAPTKSSSSAASASTAKGKGKKPSRSAIGAPSQRTQTSRKGKKAWRKNVDIDDVEEVLEGQRAEERVTGCVCRYSFIAMQGAYVYAVRRSRQCRTANSSRSTQKATTRVRPLAPWTDSDR